MVKRPSTQKNREGSQYIVDSSLVTTEDSVSTQSNVSRQGVGDVSSGDTLSLQGDTYGLRTYGNVIFACDSTNGVFRSFTKLSGNIVELDTVSFGGSGSNNLCLWPAIHNTIAIVADDQSINIIDVSDPNDLSVQSSAPLFTQGAAPDFVEFGPPSTTGNFVFATVDDSRDIEIFDYSNPADIRPITEYTSPDTTGDEGYPSFAIDPTGEYLYLSGQRVEDPDIVDVRDPTSPSKVGNWGSAGMSYSGQVDVSEDRMLAQTSTGNNSGLVTTRDHVFELWDIQDPSSPSKIKDILYNSDVISGDKFPFNPFVNNIYTGDFLFSVYALVDGGVSESVIILDIMQFEGDDVAHRRTTPLAQFDSVNSLFGVARAMGSIFVTQQIEQTISEFQLPEQSAERLDLAVAKATEGHVDNLSTGTHHSKVIHSGRVHSSVAYLVEGTFEKQYQQTYGSTLTSATTISKWGQVVPVDTSGGAFTTTLATSMLDDVSGDNAVWVDFKDVGGSVNGSNLTVDTEGPDINGGANVTLSENYGRLRAWSHDGTNWYADTV